MARPISSRPRAALYCAATALALVGPPSTAAHAATLKPMVDRRIADGTAAKALAAAKVNWRRLGLRDYRYTVVTRAFGPTERRIERVVDGQGDGIDRRYAEIERAIKQRVSTLSVRYDRRGIPLRITINPDYRVTDLTTIERVSGFRRTVAPQGALDAQTLADGTELVLGTAARDGSRAAFGLAVNVPATGPASAGGPYSIGTAAIASPTRPLVAQTLAYCDQSEAQWVYGTAVAGTRQVRVRLSDGRVYGVPVRAADGLLTFGAVLETPRPVVAIQQVGGRGVTSSVAPHRCARR